MTPAPSAGLGYHGIAFLARPSVRGRFLSGWIHCPPAASAVPQKLPESASPRARRRLREIRPDGHTDEEARRAALLRWCGLAAPRRQAAGPRRPARPGARRGADQGSPEGLRPRRGRSRICALKPVGGEQQNDEHHSPDEHASSQAGAAGPPTPVARPVGPRASGRRVASASMPPAVGGRAASAVVAVVARWRGGQPGPSRWHRWHRARTSALARAQIARPGGRHGAQVRHRGGAVAMLGTLRPLLFSAGSWPW